jgi:signal peptidase I
MRAPRHITRVLWGAIGLALVGCLWFGFAPAALGGSTSYVVTDGVSMEPRFHSGDLALVRSQADYRVGEIVAYHNRQLGTVVLHRIVGRDGSRYSFKGDNNNFTDFEHPARSQLIGALWIHVPGAGADLAQIRSPALIGILVALGTLLLGGVVFTKRRRRRRRERSMDQAPPAAGAVRDRLSAGPAPIVLACGLAAMAPFFVLAVLAFSRPDAAVLATQVPYRQTGQLAYHAQAAPGPTYPSGRVDTGDPIFTHVLRSVELAFSYRFASPAPHRLDAHARLDATVSSTSGWHTTIPLSGGPVPVTGDGGTVTGRLELAPLLGLISRVEAVTSVSGTYTLTVKPLVMLGGELAGAPLTGRFAPPSKFTLNRLEIRPITPGATSSEAAPPATSFEHAEQGSVTARRSRPAQLALGPLTLTVASARAIALGGIVAVALGLMVALALARPRRREPADEILARWGSMIVPVERVWQQPGVAVIDVADIDSLTRIAAHYERSILHERAEYGDAFWVSDESGQFRYAILDPSWTEPGPVSVQEAPAWEAAAENVHLAGPPERGDLEEPLPAWDPAAENGRPGGPAPAWDPTAENGHLAAPSGWAPAPGPPPAPEQIGAGDLRPEPPAETLRFGAVSPSALAPR